ncbi:MAG: DUF2236 domain-containing protein [Sandaracinaceae bacterium]|nr:DUF2236 domain-containing protein [Sandaracinaceae bacterium]
MPGRFTDELLDDLRTKGDPALDALMPDLMKGRRLEHVNRLLARYRVNGQPIPDDLPEELRAWIEAQARLPEWADRARIDRATAFFVDHGLSMTVMLGMVSLLECYAAEKGVRALHATDKMGYSGAERRLGETSQFVMGVMEPGALFEGGGAIPLILKVRLMHAGARFLISEGDWDAAENGVPANQEDLLGTLMSFGYTPVRHLGRIGKAVTPQEQEDFLHFWKVVGVVLGIPEAVQPADVAEAEEVVQRISERHFRPSPEGRELTAALMKVFQGLLPGGSRMVGSVYAMARHCVGDEICDILDVPKSPWNVAIEKGTLLARAFESVQQRSGLVNGLVNRLGTALLKQGGTLFTGGRKAEFRIPTEMRRAWRLPPLEAGARTRALMPTLVDELRDAAGLDEPAFEETITRLGVLVAQADGVIDDYEIEVLVEMLRAFDADASGDAARARIARIADDLERLGAHDYAARLARRLDDADAIEPGLAFACAVAYANCGIAAEERAMIEELGRDAGVGGDALAAIVEATRLRIEAVEVAS